MSWLDDLDELGSTRAVNDAGQVFLRRKQLPTKNPPQTAKGRRKKNAARAAARRANAIKYGLCVICDAPAVTKQHCEKCRQRVAANAKRRRDAKKRGAR